MVRQVTQPCLKGIRPMANLFPRDLLTRSAMRLFLRVVLSVGAFLACARAAAVAQALPAAQDPSPAASSMTLNLAECLQLALQRQPRVAAQRASLAAAEDGSQALENLMVPTLLVRQLPVRRKQAALGVSAAAAAVDQAEREAIYAVTRTYFTLQYAREQERIARSVVERLTATRDAARRQLDAGARDGSAADVNRATVYVRLAGARRTQAGQGVKRATAALKEAIGLQPEENLEVPVAALPDVGLHPSHEEIVAQALARRAELARAGVLVEVTCLEAEAQDTSHHKKMETFAAGSDIHGSLVPQGIQNSEYRPGAVPPEMPTLLAGSRADRVKRAQSFNARAQAVAETTRNLIVLEAEDAFLRWEEAALQIQDAREAADAGDKLADDVSKDFTAGLKVKVEDVVNSRVLASQARSQYNEYLYRQILALADLERISGGAFSARLVEATISQPATGTGSGTR